jgi:cyclopropane-fatty-acyl-phospholipid synthase
MGVLLGWVTGVLPSEEQSLKSHGDAYRAYQKTTSCFFPWFSRGGDRSFLENFLFCIPDGCIRWYMRKLLQQRLDALSSFELEPFLASFEKAPLAISVEASKAQHYEVPAVFFENVLGPHRKYSSCYYETPSSSLEEAEKAMLALTCKRAQLQDDQRILELGCGWGSLTLWMAKHYPRSSILAVSHSASQKKYILEECKKRNFTNVEVVTCDMNAFETKEAFDRIISVEMFEHMRNLKLLFRRLRSWIKSDGKLFVHIFSHEKYAYYFETKDDSDWLAKHFFTGGMMPSHTLYQHCTNDFQIQEDWVVPGEHYAQTAKHWLENMEKNKTKILPILQSVYGENASLFWYRWRIFFMACFELWNWKKKPTWQVSHFLFEPKRDLS